MFKKILSLVIIVLMLFSCLNNINSATLTVHARSQDNDDDYGIVVFHSTDYRYENNIIGEHWIKKGTTRTFDFSKNEVAYIELKSPGKSFDNNAHIRCLKDFFRDNPDANFYADVNFYKYPGYVNKAFINYPVFIFHSYAAIDGGYWTVTPAWNCMSQKFAYYEQDSLYTAGWHAT